ncbi:MAG: hypothetical protein CMJ31_06900 [Phycisphaerae bacterium]|nr:hypothetical protein [Phycisphaerae bacterium]
MSASAEHGEAGGRREIEVISRGLVRDGGRVLVCRAVKAGYVYLPGGHVEFGESAAEGLAREFVEELGWEVRVGELIMASEARFRQGGCDRHELNLVFHVEHTPGAEARSLETKIAFEWMDAAALVASDVRPPAVADWLAEIFSREASDQVAIFRWASDGS